MCISYCYFQDVCPAAHGVLLHKQVRRPTEQRWRRPTAASKGRKGSASTFEWLCLNNELLLGRDDVRGREVQRPPTTLTRSSLPSLFLGLNSGRTSDQEQRMPCLPASLHPALFAGRNWEPGGGVTHTDRKPGRKYFNTVALPQRWTPPPHTHTHQPTPWAIFFN